jgi:ribosomal protein S5
MRVVLEAAGYSDAVGKIFGTNNKVSNVYATISALKKINKMAARQQGKKEQNEK